MSAVGFRGAAVAEEDARREGGGVDPLDRVQLHRNPNRSVPYLPLARQGEDAGDPRLVMRAVETIPLDGDPLENVYANLRPIDVDGDGRFEFVHFNGYRFMQVWAADGRRLWRVQDREGRLHDSDAGTRRDTLAVLDLDGDGGQDIAHCWAEDGRRQLVFRRGRDGTVLASRSLEGAAASEECQLGAFRMADPERMILLVAQRPRGADAAACPHDFVGYWSRTVAFDLELRELWDRETCDAGHYAWPVDQDQDGRAEAVFVGKYLLDGEGRLRCTLAGWPREDHVDGLAIADLDPDEPGLEAVAVGRSGVALFHAATCRRLWQVSTRAIRDPQHVAIVKLDADSATPMIQVDERGSVSDARTFVITARGHVVASRESGVMAMQNANLDGALGVDESVGSFGMVIDRFGNLRLDRDWYWDMRGGRTRETRAGRYPSSYDRWQAFPLVFDYDGDGEDEIVQWGQSLIVIGKATNRHRGGSGSDHRDGGDD